MSPPASSLYMGSVMHHRLRPRAHRLRYRIFMALLDLDEIDALARSFRLFSRGRFNLFAFHAGDYGNGTGEPLRLQLERHMRAAGLTPDGGPIRLLTMPRMLGFAFNPVSLFFCHRRDGTLVAIHYEVNNTFGERHGYFLPVTEDGAPTVHQNCAKAFHVSPFIGMGLRYDFRVAPPGETLAIGITGRDAQGPLITAAFTARRRPLTDGALALAFLAYPLLTLKVVGGILWEALLLWLKGTGLHDHPNPPDHPVTIVHSGVHSGVDSGADSGAESAVKSGVPSGVPSGVSSGVRSDLRPGAA